MRFCVIGMGRAGHVHATNIHAHIKGAQLHALCDANRETLKQAETELKVERLYTDYREAVCDSNIEAVVISTPVFLHHEVACAAAREGKHIFLEKPMALSVAECVAINEEAERSGVVLQPGFMRRFDAAFLEAKEALSSGKLGRVLIIKSTGRGPGLPPPWIYDMKKSNGLLAEVNSHDFDTIRWLTDSEIMRVYVEAGNFKCTQVKQSHPDFYDNAIVALRLADDALGTIDGTCPADYGYDARVEVLCEKGVIFIGSVKDRGIMQAESNGTVVTRTVASWRNLFREAYIAELEHFISCIVNQTTPCVTGEDGLRAVEAVVAANRSIASGEPVRVEAVRA